MTMEHGEGIWPFVQAANYTKVTGTPRAIRLIVLHSTEQTTEQSVDAEDIADYFARGGSNVGSAHVTVDNDSAIQSVKEKDVAHAAPGANHDGLHIEHVGRAAQTPAQWNDPYSLAVVENAAGVAGHWAVKYGIPVVHLSDEQLKAGQSGIVDHHAVTRVYKRSTHTDPGKHYPWALFLQATVDEVERLTRPDYKVAVIYDPAKLYDKGLADLLGSRFAWGVLPLGHSETVGFAYLVGSAGQHASGYAKAKVLAGPTGLDTMRTVRAFYDRGIREP